MSKKLFVLIASLSAVAAVAVGLIVFQQDRTAPIPEQTLCEERGYCEPKTIPTSTAPVVAANATVIRMVDGDTFVATLDAEPGEWTIRLLGVNTPETVDPRRPVQCFGKEASKKLEGLIGSRRVRLESDLAADERDKYGRLLRNVILEDGTDVNASLVREGFAYAYLSFPLDKFRKVELRTLEEEAKREKRGLWADGACG